ncbi:MAG: hypothetical protein AAGD11_13645 [Planctomycetota bacterium]
MSVLLSLCSLPVAAQPSTDELPADVLSEQQWEQVNESVDLALGWLARHQNPDGSFPTQMIGQPGVTGLCTLAFLAQGHLPGEGIYGAELQSAIDYMISCQKRNGLLAMVAPNSRAITRNVDHKIGYTLVYNHAIAGLVLSESYAMVGSQRTEAIQPVIQRALDATFQMQDFPKDRRDDTGGWRYVDDFDNIDSDLSVTGWQLMFMRSAKNAGFEVDEDRIDRSIGYVRRCFLKDRGTFTYKLGYQDRASRGMAGAGILALAHAGMHHTPEAQQAGDWILKSGFHSYNDLGRVRDIVPRGDRYHYGLLTCSQAMYQLGGRHWREFFQLRRRC